MVHVQLSHKSDQQSCLQNVEIDFAFSGVMFYAIGRELFSGQTSSGVYGKALKDCKNNTEVSFVHPCDLLKRSELGWRGHSIERSLNERPQKGILAFLQNWDEVRFISFGWASRSSTRSDASECKSSSATRKTLPTEFVSSVRLWTASENRSKGMENCPAGVDGDTSGMVDELRIWTPVSVRVSEDLHSCLKAAFPFSLSHSEYEVEGRKHMRVKFYLEGSIRKGTAHVEVKQV